jgi:glutaredoxin-related protein
MYLSCKQFRRTNSGNNPKNGKSTYVTGWVYAYGLSANYYAMLRMLSKFVLLILFVANASAQPKGSISPLSLGDTMPEIAMYNIMYYKDTTGSTNQLKGKLLIICFMNNSCPTGLALLPVIDSLQHQFHRQVQFLVAMPNTKEKIILRTKIQAIDTVTMKNWQVIAITNQWYQALQGLPVLPQAKQLQSLFPHKVIPHIVWIDKHGIIRAITNSQYLNAQSIGQFLQNPTVSWPLKST